MYAPVIESARRVREHQLGPSHSGVLLTDVQSNSRITYAHLLVIFASGQADPIAFISSEAKIYKSDLFEELGLDDLDMAGSADDEEGSHFLCAFTSSGHQNFGVSNDWADLDKFERAALELVQRLQLTERG